MGVDGEHVPPRTINVRGLKPLRPLRERVREGPRGRVVEVGFGTAPHRPATPPSGQASLLTTKMAPLFSEPRVRGAGRSSS
jgi:hypothetical protein